MTLSRTKPVTRLIITASETMPAERTTLSDWLTGFGGSVTVLFKEVGNGHDAGVIIRQHYIFRWVNVVPSSGRPNPIRIVGFPNVS